jgi:hypothetical protein
MPWTFKNGWGEYLGVDGGTNVVPVDMTGADFFAVLVPHVGTVDSLTDSASNIYTKITGQSELDFYYVTNATAAANMTWTVTGTSVYCSFIVFGYAGSSSSSLDAETNLYTGPGSDTSIQMLPITPSENNCLVIAGVRFTSTTDVVTIDQSFSSPAFLPLSGAILGVAMSALTQTTAATVDPTFSWTGLNVSQGAMAAFRFSGGTRIIFGRPA